MRPEADLTKKTFDAGSNFKVIIYQSAGVSNPTKANTYGGLEDEAHEDREIFVTFGDSGVAKVWLADEDGDGKAGIRVPRVVTLSSEDGGLGDKVTATGAGFEKKVTLHFFVDKPRDKEGEIVSATAKGAIYNGVLDAGEDTVCSVAQTGSDNVGSCEFTVTTPTFGRGFSYINAVDGDGNNADEATNDDQRFELKASISATPAGGSPGEIMQVQLVSFPANAGVAWIKLSGSYIWRRNPAECNGS